MDGVAAFPLGLRPFAHAAVVAIHILMDDGGDLGVVEGGVEDLVLLLATPLDGEIEGVGPLLAGVGAGLVKRNIPFGLVVVPCADGIDRREGDFGVQLGGTALFKFDVGGDIGVGFGLVLGAQALYRHTTSEEVDPFDLLVEGRMEEDLLVFRPAGEVGGIPLAGDGVAIFADSELVAKRTRSPVAVEDRIQVDLQSLWLALRIGVAVKAHPLGGGQLGLDAIFGDTHRIVARLGLLGFFVHFDRDGLAVIIVRLDVFGLIFGKG